MRKVLFGHLFSIEIFLGIQWFMIPFCGQQRLWSYCKDAQAGLGLCCPHMPEDMFSYGTAYTIFIRFELITTTHEGSCQLSQLLPTVKKKYLITWQRLELDMYRTNITTYLSTLRRPDTFSIFSAIKYKIDFDEIRFANKASSEKWTTLWEYKTKYNVPKQSKFLSFDSCLYW